MRRLLCAGRPSALAQLSLAMVSSEGVGGRGEAAAAAAQTRHHRKAHQRQHKREPPTVPFNLGNGILISAPAAEKSPRRRRGWQQQRAKEASHAQEPAPVLPPPSPSSSTSAPPAPPATTTSAADSLAAAAHAVQRDLVVHRLTSGSRGTERAGSLGLPSPPPAGNELAVPVDPAALAQRSLPLLLSATEVLAGREAATDRALVAAFASAQRDVARYVRWLEETARRTTGRRYEAAFPASLVAQLWATAMPSLSSLAAQLRQRSRGPRDAVAGGGEEPQTTEAGNTVVAQPQRPGGTREAEQAFLQSFRDARRVLALRTRTVADVLVKQSPDGLVRTLAQMQHCGALSDDILGPVAGLLLSHFESAARDGTGENAQKIAKNHTLTAQQVATPLPLGNVDTATLSPSAAITLARLLGRQQAPNHFQLHKLTHTVLLPPIQRALAASAAALIAREEEEGARAIPPRAALVDLTKCFVHYAVSGSAVEHLATLWQPYLHPRHQGSQEEEGEGAFTVSDCTELLRILAQPPAVAANEALLRRPEKLSGSASASLNELYAGVGGGGGARRRARREGLVAADEYVPLVEMLCGSVAATCEAYLQRCGSAVKTDGEGEEGREDAAVVVAAAPSAIAVSTREGLSPPDLSPEVLLGWMLALLKVNSPRWAEVYTLSATATLVSLTRAPSSHSHGRNSDPTACLPVPLVEKFLYELIHRNTHIPAHALHTLLLRRLLHAKETRDDATYASTALLAFELMSPSTKQGEQMGQKREASAEGEEMVEEATAPAPLASPAVEQAVVATGEEGLWGIGAGEAATAFALLQHHGGALGITAFVAALCVSPLHELPAKAQRQLLQHFTSIASAVHPSWLARGIVAVTGKLSPEVVGSDGVSVHKWYSRFTARDVTRKLDLAQCAGLIAVLSTRPAYLADNAIALHALVHRVGALLKSDRQQDAALAALPDLIPALHSANVLFAPLFSRMCRLMLSEVKDAPWELLLPAFTATAEEFMRRSRQEASATVFRDVWELLRQRVMADAAESLELPDVVAALDGFAALDVGDRPLFLVLTRRLWITVLAETAAQADSGDGKALQVEEEDKEELSRVAHSRARMGGYLCSALTPSALAALATTLLYKRSGPDVDVMLPWVLLGLSGHAVRELYPIDVVHLMPALLAAFTDASAGHEEQHHKKGEEADVALLLGLLHRAYDACREQFLLMYQVAGKVSEEGAPAVGGGMDGLAAPPATTSSLAELQVLQHQREGWDAKVKASVDLVPKRYFASILVELSGSGLADAAVATACAAKCCTTRCCQELLSIQHLVDVCMALCVQFPPSPSPKAASTEAGKEVEKANAEPSPSALNAIFMPPVLGALWRRTDELDAAQIDALLRCLRFHYGENVDGDFVDRLQGQKRLLVEERPAPQRRHRAEEPMQGASSEARPRESSQVGMAAAATQAASQTSAPPSQWTSSVDDSVAEWMLASLGEP